MPKIISCKSIIKKLFLLVLIINILGYPLYCENKEENKVVEIGLSPDLFEIYTDNDNEKCIRPKQDTVYEDIVINKSIPYNLIFQYVTFKGKVIFRNATCEKKIYFLDVKFEKDAVFRAVTCKEAVYFSDVSFESDVSFFRSIFEKETSFELVEFHKNVTFREAKFRENTIFRENCFNQQANFSFTQFPVDNLEKDLDFTDSKFYGIVLFYKTLFPLKTSFNNVLINKEIDLTSIDDKQSPDTCHIDLVGATIDKIKLSYEKFRVYFDDAKDLSFDQKNHVYLKLLSKQKNDGFVNSHKKLDLEYREFYHSHGTIWDKILYPIKKIWWNFGYNKERIFIIALILLLVFSFINYWIFNYLMKVYPVDNIKKIIEKRDKNSKNNIFKRIFSTGKYSVKYFTLALYYTGSIFFGLKVTINKFEFSKPWGVAYILVIYISGLICAAYMFNFIISI